MTFQPWALLSVIPPCFAVVYLLWKIERERKRTKWPLTEPLLRPPGESLRLRLEEYDEQLMNRFLFLVIPIFFAVMVSYSNLTFTICIALLFVSVLFTIFAGSKLQKTVKERRDYYLASQGERAVGQEISQALSFGYKVYHDLQFDGFNIDHVIIGPSGVYAVETKTRRKSHAENSHKVAYDGQKLIFPKWEDSHGIEQAQRNAKHLSNWLGKAVGQAVWVEPVLTLPGWWIDRLKPGSVNVLNPKEIVGLLTRSTKTVLSPIMIQQISHQVEQRSLIL